MKFLKFAKGVAAVAALALTAATVAPAPARADDDSMLQHVMKTGTLTVGMSTFVPWAMRGKDGNLIGFEVDVATKLAKDMGVKLHIVPTAWAGIIPALLAKKFDIIISGLSITPERNLTVNFTRPYAHSGQQMAANKKLAGKFTSLSDYNNPDVTITCRRGATPCDMAQQMFPKATLRRFDTDAQAYQEVLNGNAYAVISSAPKPAFEVADNPDVLFLANNGENLQQSNEAFGIRKGDVDSLNFFSNWILFNTANGWLKERHDYWFTNRANWADRAAEK
jgi:polar amino acid transport system substrate-binding protein